MRDPELKAFLDKKVELYQQAYFIETDPIQIPKQFSKKEDIEIAAFIAASLAWGQRPQIIKKAKLWLEAMDGQPHDFLLHAHEKEFQKLSSFVYRTFNSDDCMFFMYSLRNIYQNHGGLENVFSKYPRNIKQNINHFRTLFLQSPHLPRSEKHIANPEKGSAAKRINMFLRWMIRSAYGGVDFGLWKQINSSALMIPLDIHSGGIARVLGLLERKQNDWKSVEELTQRLRSFDSADPIKYDFALFGMGAFEGKLAQK